MILTVHHSRDGFGSKYARLAKPLDIAVGCGSTPQDALADLLYELMAASVRPLEDHLECPEYAYVKEYYLAVRRLFGEEGE